MASSSVRVALRPRAVSIATMPLPDRRQNSSTEKDRGERMGQPQSA